MSITPSAYLREHHAALEFVNNVRQYLGKELLNALPGPEDLGYTASSCPIALAIDEEVSVDGDNIITENQAVARAIQELYNASTVEFWYGSFTIKAPKAVKEFVLLFDSVYALEQNLVAAKQKLATVAASTSNYAPAESYAW